MSKSSSTFSVLEIYILPAGCIVSPHVTSLCIFVHLFSIVVWRWANQRTAVLLRLGRACPLRRRWGVVDHKWACSELWSLSWLSSLAKESVEWWSAAMPENSDGCNVPFFTLVSSFSRAAAPCWPPFTLFHFIRLFWNHTFTWLGQQTDAQKKENIKECNWFTAAWQLYLLRCATTPPAALPAAPPATLSAAPPAAWCLPVFLLSQQPSPNHIYVFQIDE